MNSSDRASGSAQDSGEDFTEAQITEFMQDEGYTPEAIYEE